MLLRVKGTLRGKDITISIATTKCNNYVSTKFTNQLVIPMSNITEKIGLWNKKQYDISNLQLNVGDYTFVSPMAIHCWIFMERWMGWDLFQEKFIERWVDKQDNLATHEFPLSHVPNQPRKVTPFEDVQPLVEQEILAISQGLQEDFAISEECYNGDIPMETYWLLYKRTFHVIKFPKMNKMMMDLA
jgi:hypothetical protein